MSAPAPFDPRDVPMPAGYIMRKFGLSRTTLWRWRSSGLPSQGVGAKTFIKESDVVAFIAAQSAQSAQTEGAKQ